MVTTIDKAGRVVIPAEIRNRLSLAPGTELEIEVEGFTVRLARTGPGPELSQRKGRLIARPLAPAKSSPDIDVAKLIEEERDRWP